MKASREVQGGMALVVALLVLAIASGLATGMILQNQRAIESTTNAFEGARADRLAEGAIEVASAVLAADSREVDSPADDWARPVENLPAEGGQVSLRIVDLQGRLNLNNLIDRQGRVDPLARERLQRLFEELDIPSRRVDAIADWIDDNQTPGAAGAEDGRYLSRTPAYRTADSPLRTVSELRAIAGFTATEYARLAPHVAALPPGSALNLNTATEVVARAISGKEGESAAKRTPQTSVDRALSTTPWRGGDIYPRRLAVSSNYFLCAVRVRFDRTIRRRIAVIERDQDGATRIIAMSNRPCLKEHYCI